MNLAHLISAILMMELFLLLKALNLSFREQQCQVLPSLMYLVHLLPTIVTLQHLLRLSFRDQKLGVQPL